MIKSIAKVFAVVAIFSATAYAASSHATNSTTHDYANKTQLDVVGNDVVCTGCFNAPSKATKVKGIGGSKVIALNESNNRGVVTVKDEGCDAGKWFVINKRDRAVAHPLIINTCKPIADVEIEDINNVESRIVIYTYDDNVLTFVVSGR
ncbi:hypothetical protein DQR70_06260 [Salmonella enterica subsp. enterica serovar Oslo]|nr:hypothetical protein [Salmonella enterica subsp. enterica serovar Oslo]